MCQFLELNLNSSKGWFVIGYYLSLILSLEFINTPTTRTEKKKKKKKKKKHTTKQSVSTTTTWTETRVFTGFSLLQKKARCNRAAN